MREIENKYRAAASAAYVPVVPIVVKALAEGSSVTQSAFLGAFARAMRDACEDHQHTEAQISYLAEHLDEDGRWLVDYLHEFLHPDEGES